MAMAIVLQYGVVEFTNMEEDHTNAFENSRFKQP